MEKRHQLINPIFDINFVFRKRSALHQLVNAMNGQETVNVCVQIWGDEHAYSACCDYLFGENFLHENRFNLRYIMISNWDSHAQSGADQVGDGSQLTTVNVYRQ